MAVKIEVIKRKGMSKNITLKYILLFSKSSPSAPINLTILGVKP